jgi:hypothetical protein
MTNTVSANNTITANLSLQEVKASGRTFLTTDEFAFIAELKPQTIRKRYCQHGHYFNVRPKKLSNRLLHWPIAEVEVFLSGDSKPSSA